MQEIIYSYVFPDIKPSLTVNSNTYNFTLCPRKSYVTNASESCVTLYKKPLPFIYFHGKNVSDHPFVKVLKTI